jgi:hypothetical protein
MRRRDWLVGLLNGCVMGVVCGCRGTQYGHVLSSTEKNLVGSHEAGSEVFDPLVDEAVSKLLARQEATMPEYHPGPECPLGPDGQPLKKSVCFIGVENKMVEDIGDFKDQLYQQLDSRILESDAFRPISRRMVDAALHETRLRPDSLMIPDNMRMFTAVLQRDGAPVDYLLYATLTSGTTKRNTSTQRDYLLTLEMINVHNGSYDKQSSEIRKGYHKTAMGQAWNYNPFKR